MPRNAGEGEVDFMLVCRKTTNWLITSMKTLFLSVKICVRWCDLYEVEDERGGSVPHAALAFGWHAVGFVQCVPVGDAPRALRVPTPCGRGVGTVRPRWGRPSVMGSSCALRVPTLWGTVWGCCSASPLGTALCRDGLVLCSACRHAARHRGVVAARPRWGRPSVMGLVLCSACPHAAGHRVGCCSASPLGTRLTCVCVPVSKGEDDPLGSHCMKPHGGQAVRTGWHGVRGYPKGGDPVGVAQLRQSIIIPRNSGNIQ